MRPGTQAPEPARADRELGELAASCPPEEFAERRAELARAYDHHFVHPGWVPELERKYGLKLLGKD